ncbi:iron-containing alcohol dehydrogenase [Chitinilyticum piscinae]|uniref:Iron-containing alcohol dehydrogenase n=1 Tax=Chitinilyticum piscinae TaxID=2866724 RepID=A0A8J7K2H2_9NEIS|nr:iron-containing alcohol dehydrogenase [Chitinilyticum piscinae]MBE9610027.1 iron-containing alcohol dehydrogenase [Chitinilyticum piscinae]
MLNFSFHAPTRIHFGRDQVRQLTSEIPAGSRVLLTSGGSSIRVNGVLEAVLAQLAHCTVIEFAGIEPNPEFETLRRAVELGRREQADWVLAVGGGSVIDGSKWIAAALDLDPAIDPWLLVGNKTRVRSARPLGVVLTLPATGAESNHVGVISRRETQDKQSFRSEHVFPRFAVLDPCFTFSLPPRQVGNGVVDAFVHTLEQYLTYPVDARVQDRMAEGILQTLIEVGPQTLAEPGNYDARANYMWAANQALFGLVGAGQPQDWASHAIGHELTALYGLDHARSLSVIVPALLQYCRADKAGKLLQYGQRVWGLAGSDAGIIDAAIAATRDFFVRMGLPVTLAEAGIDAAEAALRVEANLPRHKPQPVGEHGKLTPADCAAIVRMSV